MMALLMRKSFSHKYLRKEPGADGRWRYIYREAAGDKPVASPASPESGTMGGMDNGRGTGKGSSGNGSRPPSLKENIHTILYGTAKEKEALRGKHFHVTDTPDFMKTRKIGLTGDYFTVRYGVVSRHLGKDANHEYTEATWNDLCTAITKPFAIANHGDKGRRLFTNVKLNGNWVVVGVDVKTAGEGLEVNSITTAFGFNPGIIGEIIYTSEKITPEQRELLVRLSRPLPSAQGGTASASSLSPPSEKKSSENSRLGEKNG